MASDPLGNRLSPSSIATTLPYKGVPSEPPSRGRRLIFAWGPALLWLAMVAVFSARQFGASNSHSVLRWIFDYAHFHVSPESFLAIHFTVRKAAHFLSYGALSALFFRALRDSFLRRRVWRLRWAMAALFLCLLAASADELHQYYTPGRTGTLHDVVLDMVGGLFAQVTIVALGITPSKKKHLPR